MWELSEGEKGLYVNNWVIQISYNSVSGEIRILK